MLNAVFSDAMQMILIDVALDAGDLAVVIDTKDIDAINDKTVEHHRCLVPGDDQVTDLEVDPLAGRHNGVEKAAERAFAMVWW